TAFVLIAVGDSDVLAPGCMGLWCAAVGAIVVARRRRWIAMVALASVAAALVATAVAAGAGVREPPALAKPAAGSRSIEILAIVTGRPVDGRARATVVEADGVGGLGVPVLLFADVSGAGIGDELAARVTVVRADAGDEVAFLAFARDEVRVDRPAQGVLAAAGELRDRFAAIAAGLPPPGAGLLPGLAIGDTSAVGAELDADMKTSSLSHLTAVSGSNCAVVVGLVFVVAAAAGLSRWARVGVAGVALAGFVILVTPEPSVVRAAAMAAIALGALAVSRPGRGIPLLCVAVLGLLVLDPWLARSFGFALSVLATAGLLCLAAPLARAFGRVVPGWIALLLAVPLAAQLACQPVLLLLDPALPLYGVIANVLAEPAAPVATVIGLVACLLATFVPPLAVPVAWIAWVPAAWIAAVARFTADLPGARSPWPVGPLGVTLLVFISLAGVVLVLGSRRRGLMMIARSVLLVAVVAYSATLAGTRVVTDLGRPADWQIALCDVGQGDAAVIRDSGVVAVIDTGPEPARLTACLEQLGIDRIQLLVLTHYDLDHVGGVDAVIGRVDRALIGPASDPGDEAIAEALAQAGAEVEQVTRGEQGTIGRLAWRVIWPPPRGVEPGNPASVTVQVQPSVGCSCLSGVFLGDLGEESQIRLLAADPPGHLDVVKVAHHGSADQAAALYENVHATVGLIGVGADNDYGHPTDALLGILAAVGTEPYRTDRDGLILVAPGDRPGELRVWTERGG
ncbi:MAG: ComEC/Rec2 family competence protein, partial [Pseudolysinimonas sp.]